MTLDLHPYIVVQFHDRDCITRDKPARPAPLFPIVAGHKIAAYPAHIHDGSKDPLRN